MKLWKYSVLFYLGGTTYMAMELVWRGWSHGAMFVLGGTCFLLIGALGERDKPMPWLLRAVAGAGIITALEFGCGMLLNQSYQIWDYRHMPCNLRGQICLPFSLLWIPVSLLADVLYRKISRHLRY